MVTDCKEISEDVLVNKLKSTNPTPVCHFLLHIKESGNENRTAIAKFDIYY